jgi:hypothetical protein
MIIRQGPIHVNLWHTLIISLQKFCTEVSHVHRESTKANDPKGLDWLTIVVNESSILSKLYFLVLFEHWRSFLTIGTGKDHEWLHVCLSILADPKKNARLL